MLPIGSDDIRAAVDPEKAIKSIMFYGPSGTGKTLAVEAVSHELGALLIHLTPGDIRSPILLIIMLIAMCQLRGSVSDVIRVCLSITHLSAVNIPFFLVTVF